MDIEQLLRELESLALKVHVPGFQELIQTVRNIYEKTIEYITPHEPISDASRTLTALHSELDSLCTQLETSLPAFQAVYTGAGSDSYHTSAAFALQGMQQQRDALVYASQQHQTMATQFALAQEMQNLLIVMLGVVAVTLVALVASGGSDAPITVPLLLGETAGAAAIIATLTEALVSASVAVSALLAFLGTADGLALLAATAVVVTGLTHPNLIPHIATTPNRGPQGSTILQVSQAQKLPIDPSKVVAGGRIYIPPTQKGGRREPVRAKDGSFIDDKGNIWKWAVDKHAGEHWDVTHKDGTHTNVASDGKIIGDDNFPNRNSLKK